MSYRTKTKYTGVYTRQSATKRHDGKPDVCFDICYKTPEGKLVWEKVGWRSEGYSATTASEVRSERVRQSRHPEIAPPRLAITGCMTMHEAWTLFRDRWLPSVKRPEEEISRYTTHIAPRFGAMTLAAITPLMLEDFKHNLLNTESVRSGRVLAPGTVRHILSDIRRVYRKLTEWGVYSGPIPTAHIKPPKVDNQRERFLTPREADRLLSALEIMSCTWWRISMISLYTGLRLGEILSLCGQNIDFAAGLIMVAGKTGRRAAYISPRIAPVLKSLVSTSPTALLFTKRSGAPIEPSDQSKSFARAVALVGLNVGITDRRRKVVFHTLRHTFASWLAQSGVPLYTIGELMGHATVQMTKRYAKLSPDTKRDAIEFIARMHASSHRA